MREPLGYRLARQSGSHQRWESKNGYPPLRLAFHARAQLAPGLVRSILTKGVGLPEEEARALL
jgi:predicted RNA binding protein YcfA (HicA-like mRNA interferase family)